MYLSVLYGVKMNYDGAIALRGAHEVYSLKKIDLKKITSFSLRAKLLLSFGLKASALFQTSPPVLPPQMPISFYCCAFISLHHNSSESALELSILACTFHPHVLQGQMSHWVWRQFYRAQTLPPGGLAKASDNTKLWEFWEFYWQEGEGFGRGSQIQRVVTAQLSKKLG